MDVRELYQKYLKDGSIWGEAIEIIEYISSLGDSGLGFRLAGGEAEREAVKYISEKLKDYGVDKVDLYKVDVDKWVFRDAYIETGDGRRINGVTFAGYRGGEASGKPIYVGKGTLDEVSKASIDGGIALIELDYGLFGLHIAPIYQAYRAGARGIVITMSRDSPYSSMEDTIFTMDGTYFDELPPVVIVKRSDFKTLMEAGSEISLRVDASIGEGYGYNVVATLNSGGEDTVIISAHHDSHFNSVIDNASGIGLLLNTASRLAREEGLSKRYVIVSFTAEEYGKSGTIYDYLIGSHTFFSRDFRDNEDTWIHINIDSIGEANGPLGLRYTPELGTFIYGLLMDLSGLLDIGVSIRDTPSLWLDMWPSVYHGLSSLALTNLGNREYYGRYYHTPLDGIRLLDRRVYMHYYSFLNTLTSVLDKCRVPPIDYSALGRKIMGCIIPGVMDDNSLRSIYRHLSILTGLGASIYPKLSIVNRGMVEGRFRKVRKGLLLARRILLRQLYWIDPSQQLDLDPSNPLEAYQDRIMRLTNIIKLEGDLEEEVMNLPTVEWGRHIDMDTYRWILARLNKDEYWAKERIIRTGNYIEVYHYYINREIDKLTRTAYQLLEIEADNLKNYLKRLLSDLEIVNRILHTIREELSSKIFKYEAEEEE